MCHNQEKFKLFFQGPVNSLDKKLHTADNHKDKKTGCKKKYSRTTFPGYVMWLCL